MWVSRRNIWDFSDTPLGIKRGWYVWLWLHPGTSQQPPKPSSPPAQTNGPKKRKSEDRADVKEETVEEDGLYYGELDNDNMEYNEVTAIYWLVQPSGFHTSACSHIDTYMSKGLKDKLGLKEL
jgi:hypothetical protein